MSGASSRKSMKDLQQQLQAIQAEITARRQTAKTDLREEFDAKLAENELTLQDIYPEINKVTAGKRAKATKVRAGIPKYKNPSSGDTWSGGKGPVPKWIKAICAEKGITLDQFKEMPEFLNQ